MYDAFAIEGQFERQLRVLIILLSIDRAYLVNYAEVCRDSLDCHVKLCLDVGFTSECGLALDSLLNLQRSRPTREWQILTCKFLLQSGKVDQAYVWLHLTLFV